MPLNYELSEGDKSLIALLYPRKTERKNEVLRLTASAAEVKFIDDTVSKIYRFQPVMSIKANIVEEVILVLMLADNDGYYISDNNDEFNINGYVGSFKRFFTKQGSISTNDPSFEISIPYKELPLENIRRPLNAYIALYTKDKDGAYKRLYGLEKLYSLK